MMAMSQYSLLAITAHPDDESILCGGLLASCSAQGATVNLLCLTHGEHGHGEGDIAACRRAELSAATGILGISSLTVLNHEDGMLRWLDQNVICNDIGKAIDNYSPDVIITFDEDGMYGHPDHIALHHCTTRAIKANPLPALYYGTTPPRAMRKLTEYIAKQCASNNRPLPNPTDILGVTEPDAWGHAAPLPTFIFEANNYSRQKLLALRCHKSQVRDGALNHVLEADASLLLGTEHYRRAAVGDQGRSFIESLNQSLS
mgnify:CR=1 FL=1